MSIENNRVQGELLVVTGQDKYVILVPYCNLALQPSGEEMVVPNIYPMKNLRVKIESYQETGSSGTVVKCKAVGLSADDMRAVRRSDCFSRVKNPHRRTFRFIGKVDFANAHNLGRVH